MNLENYIKEELDRRRTAACVVFGLLNKPTDQLMDSQFQYNSPPKRSLIQQRCGLIFQTRQELYAPPIERLMYSETRLISLTVQPECEALNFEIYPIVGIQKNTHQ